MDQSKEVDVIFGADGGASNTRVRVERMDTGQQAEGVWEAGTNLYAGSPASVGLALSSALTHAYKPFGDLKPRLRAGCIGTAGIAAPGDVERHRAAFLARPEIAELGDRLMVVGDVDLILGLSEAPIRVALIAGTGSNACGVRYDDVGNKIAEYYAGGLGLDLADQGSAAWVAHTACRRAVEFYGTDEHRDFVREVYGYFGIDLDEADAWRKILPIRTGISKADLAGLTARVVVPFADRRGKHNPARRILSEAADQLTALAVVPLRRLRAIERIGIWRDATPVDLLLVGGMWKNDYLYRGFSGWHAFQQPHVRLVRNADPTLGALALARTLL